MIRGVWHHDLVRWAHRTGRYLELLHGNGAI
jgi:hypothetical protein